MTLPDYLPGTLVADRYRVVRPLGQGGMGAVLEVEHVQLEVRRALKVLLPEAAKDAEGAERFLRGARNAARIQHPNVCQVHDFGVMEDGRQFLAMEFISGRSLGQAMKAGEIFEVQQALIVVRSIALALEAAHALGVIHRDLKPDNIMLGPDWETGVGVKVVDFDIARRMGEGETQDLTLTRPNFTVGTPEYMSPEQASGQRLDGRSDLYSLGLILYRMISGVLPFQGSNSQEVMVSRLIRDPIPIQQAAPHLAVPDGVSSLLGSLLARDPADRVASAGNVVERLERWMRAPEEGRDPLEEQEPHGPAEPSAEDGPPVPLSATTVLGSVREEAEWSGSPEPSPRVAPETERTEGQSPRSWLRWSLVGGMAIAVVMGLWAVSSGVLRDGSGSVAADPSSQGETVSSNFGEGAGEPGTSEPSTEPGARPAPGEEGAAQPSPGTGQPPPPMLPAGTDAERTTAEAAEGLDTVVRPVVDDEADELFTFREEPRAGAGPIALPEVLDDLLTSLASALTARDAVAVRDLYPGVLDSELEIWWELLGGDEGGSAESLEFSPVTALEVDGEQAEIRTLMARIRREGQEEVTPRPFRLVLDMGSGGSLQVRELRRLWN